jgi:hypothetical protein
MTDEQMLQTRNEITNDIPMFSAINKVLFMAKNKSSLAMA